MKSTEDSFLSAYAKKRNPDATPEPFGNTIRPGSSLFVVHQHAATHDHFDLRLEIEGVLWSWAVPKGPSPDPRDKRLAIAVEQHPLDYFNFEGLIPEGNYGAGAMIIWDRGRWLPKADPVAGFEKGKLLFDLQGHKLHGRWTLVKTQGGPKHWLLIKESDGWTDERGPDLYNNDSVVSGLSVTSLLVPRQGQRRALAAFRRLKAAQAPVNPHRVKPMLCTKGEVFSHADWLFEVKYDGYRVIASKNGDQSALTSRAGKDLSTAFPELVEALGWLPVDRIVLDGELVIHDHSGRPDFALLQQRAQLARPFAIRQACLALPATIYCFDLLGLGDLDTRSLKLTDRKHWLRRLLPSTGLLRYVDHVEEQGEVLFHHAGKMRLEGIVGKHRVSTYEGRRSSQWIKIPALKTQDFMIIGCRLQKAGNQVGSLHVARKLQGKWVYRGRVGSGLDEPTSDSVFAAASKAPAPTPACEVSDAGPLDRWCLPEMACAISYKNLTRAGRLRQPVFVQLMPNLGPDDCIDDLPDWEWEDEPAAQAESPSVVVTNPQKVFWPDEGYTKRDLVDYYEAISTWMLPFLSDRPLVLTRFPDGITGKHFFQKDAPAFLPNWFHTTEIWSEGGERTIRYLLAQSPAALGYIANLGAIPLHVWSSRAGSLDLPDYSIIDFDPKQAPFDWVVKLAKAVHRVCDDLGLPNYVKTSGATGLHVFIPLAGQLSYEQSRMLAELIARVVLQEHADIGTITRSLRGRQSKVYLDCLQNGHGKTIVAPFSVRPLPGAPVSMPLRWHEVNAKLRPDRFTISNAVRRMRALRVLPWITLLEDQPDLLEALERLKARL